MFTEFLARQKAAEMRKERKVCSVVSAMVVGMIGEPRVSTARRVCQQSHAETHAKLEP